MRLSLFLLVEFILLSPSCKVSKSHELLKEYPYNSLDKYSYPLFILDEQNKYRDIGTGFFYQRDKKTYLISAYHLFTGINLLRKDTSEIIHDSLEVWYKDFAGNNRSQRLSLKEHTKMPWIEILKYSDIDMMDVSSYFKDGAINSIEKNAREINQLLVGDTVVAFGFSHTAYSTLDSLKKNLSVLPQGYIRIAMDTPDNQRKGSVLSEIYQYIRPQLDSGVSGAPIFRVKTNKGHKKTIEFVGVQSLSDTMGTHSMIVKGVDMFRMLDYLK